MVGLSASELQAEMLFPGDTIEYFSMAFVAGDPRGHRVSKVLCIDRKNNEFPIRVDTQEMLPLTIMLKRKRDRNDAKISSNDAKWRKLRTFMLVDGQVEGETCADRLNAGIQKSVLDAVRLTKKQMAKDKVDTGGKKLISSYFTEVHALEGSQSSLSALSVISTQMHGRREPLYCQDNREDCFSSKFRDLKWGNDAKLAKKSRHQNDAVRCEGTLQNNKQKSCKRKRSESSTEQFRRPISGLKKERVISSKYFVIDRNRQVKKTCSDLQTFVDHAQEVKRGQEIKKIEKEKRTVWGLNKYLALDEKKKRREVEAQPRAASNRSSGRFDTFEKSEWRKQRASYNTKHKEINGALWSWLKPLDKREYKCATTSQGAAAQGQLSKQRTWHKVAKEHHFSEKKGKMLSFSTPLDANKAVYRSKESNDRIAKPVARRNDQPLGSSSAQASLTGQWNHRKTFC